MKDGKLHFCYTKLKNRNFIDQRFTCTRKTVRASLICTWNTRKSF